MRGLQNGRGQRRIQRQQWRPLQIAAKKRQPESAHRHRHYQVQPMEIESGFVLEVGHDQPVQVIETREQQENRNPYDPAFILLDLRRKQDDEWNKEIDESQEQGEILP